MEKIPMAPLPHQVINKHHAQCSRPDEIVWGDSLLVHKEMSLAKLNYVMSDIAWKVISMSIEPFD